VLNRGLAPRTVSFDFAHENVGDDVSRREARFHDTPYRIRDLWARREMGTTARPLNATVPPHDVLMMRLTRM
jgi:alpha-galactosidase